jgi:hypothetical protein
METKSNEIVIKTSKLEEMKGKYLAERLLRTWAEDFVDQDTSEVVSIERNEIILEKGTLLEGKELTEVNFFLQSGDVKSVSVSNQERGCSLVYGNSAVWMAKIKLNGKNKTIYLYANSVQSATNICIDYVEQKYVGNFKFIGIKEIDYSTLISLDMKEEDASEENDYYKTEVEVTYENDEPINEVYIINASNAEKAKTSIIDFITINNEKKNESTPFYVTIISAKTIPCDDIIDVDFSKSYLIE